ncbi:MAG: dTDP-4-dehydrorhamnose reductase [Deltaproteobacteria bacterium]|jgi:dTDP-4-dehydrorhamnose reductase|nr:dTDP-4-dehydrorhamnose reductase [Deltaproteobacteria bacterium]MBT6432253.1 dTDP-4-dehydrorhamnose reductase [Deltaproteobacteria bacterium]MBT6488284.1 dTDP-4-dehydrorhamnose reductase [Deltaproteobacteria bacterium]
MSYSVLITGAGGMLGRSLCQKFRDHKVFAMGRDELDVTSQESVLTNFQELQPDVVIHCAAMTQVDDCETDQERAFEVNHLGALHVAQAAKQIKSRLIAISTDYVFKGDALTPYPEDAPTAPQTIYGQSKLAGERAVLDEYADAIVARVAWLYGPGGPSFLHTMMRLGTAGGDPMQVVNDQIGNPTSTLCVANHIGLLLNSNIRGVVNLTCEGEATWFEFTRAIFEQVGIERKVSACTSDAFPRPAPRPANSRLENRVLVNENIQEMPHWREALNDFLKLHPEG